MDLADFRLVVEVHLMGAVNCCKAVWDVMRAQNYGRIVMTTSSSGLYGNFGQSNYGTAKMALDLARQNWREQRAPKDVRVYLEAALAANDPAAAKPALDFIARTHLTDVEIDPLIKQLQAANVHADAVGKATVSSPSVSAAPLAGSGR